MPKFCSGLFGFLNRVTAPTLTPGSKFHQDGIGSTYYVNTESTTPWQFPDGNVENGLPTEPIIEEFQNFSSEVPTEPGSEDFESSSTVLTPTSPSDPQLPQGKGKPIIICRKFTHECINHKFFDNLAFPFSQKFGLFDLIRQ